MTEWNLKFLDTHSKQGHYYALRGTLWLRDRRLYIKNCSSLICEKGLVFVHAHLSTGLRPGAELYTVLATMTLDSGMELEMNPAEMERLKTFDRLVPKLLVSSFPQ